MQADSEKVSSINQKDWFKGKISSQNEWYELEQDARRSDGVTAPGNSEEKSRCDT